MNKREQEHFEVAQSMHGWFSPADFKHAYQLKYPSRPGSSILPSDYCHNRHNKGNGDFPRFLEWDGSKSYRFVGIEYSVGLPQQAQQHPAPPKMRSGRKSTRHSVPLFTPNTDSSLTLNEQVCRAALDEYNADSLITRQEASAFGQFRGRLSQGFVRAQLQAINSAYSTRSSNADLDIVAKTIEEQLTDYSSAVNGCFPLHEKVCELEVLEFLLTPFLNSGTKNRLRSLSTKVLQFAKPDSFIAADQYAVDKLGSALQAGCWNDADGLDCGQFSQWYQSYLQVVKDIAVKNESLFGQLMQLDCRTTQNNALPDARGIPKILDKILWYVGREESNKGVVVQLFEHH